jgi:hypothetical protein
MTLREQTWEEIDAWFLGVSPEIYRYFCLKPDGCVDWKKLARTIGILP